MLCRRQHKDSQRLWKGFQCFGDSVPCRPCWATECFTVFPLFYSIDRVLDNVAPMGLPVREGVVIVSPGLHPGLVNVAPSGLAAACVDYFQFSIFNSPLEKSPSLGKLGTYRPWMATVQRGLLCLGVLLGEDFDVAAAGVAVFDDADLCGDALAHGVGVADDAYFLAL